MNDAIVTTTTGRIRGLQRDGVHVFKGIPYAAPPVGRQRFLPPEPATRWDGVRDCTTSGPICPQTRIVMDGLLSDIMSSSEPHDEDCLFLNVWTPGIDDARRPVMVWIHGGAFVGGSGSSAAHDGSTFARDGVVLVTLNYRLHALGFLYVDEDFDGASGTGNAGILDQVAALAWVQENIAAFGGDPDNVTIFGESAGGMSVGSLLGTPAARGLFHRAIAQSGAACHNLPAATARRVTRRVLELAGVAPGDWDALRALPAERLVEIGTSLGYFEADGLLEGEQQGTAMVFLPVVDGTTRPARALELVAAGAAAGVDLVVGTCAEECRLFVYAMPASFRDFIPVPDSVGYFARTGRGYGDIRAVYQAAKPSADDRDLAIAVWTDGLFAIPAVRLAEAQATHHDGTWMYRLSWPTPVLDGGLGACHALDLPFVFDRMDWTGFVGEEPPAELARDIHDAWVRFAATGDPNGGNLPYWPRYDSPRRAVIDFDTPIRILDDPDGDVRRLWDGVWAPAAG